MEQLQIVNELVSDAAAAAAGKDTAGSPSMWVDGLDVGGIADLALELDLHCPTRVLGVEGLIHALVVHWQLQTFISPSQS